MQHLSGALLDQVVDHVGGDYVDGPDCDEPTDRERPARVLVLAVRRCLVVHNRHDQQHLRAPTHSTAQVLLWYLLVEGLCVSVHRGPGGMSPNSKMVGGGTRSGLLLGVPDLTFTLTFIPLMKIL